MIFKFRNECSIFQQLNEQISVGGAERNEKEQFSARDFSKIGNLTSGQALETVYLAGILPKSGMVVRVYFRIHGNKSFITSLK